MNRAGFTLIELLIALTMSVFVMIAIVGVSTSMIRYQFEGIRRGEATGSSLVALDRIHTELENATYLQLPAAGVPGDVLTGCLDWSALMINPSPPPTYGYAIDRTPANVSSFYYCVDGNSTLWRYSKQGVGSCPYGAAPNCGTTSGGEALVPQVFFHTQPPYEKFFRRSLDTTGVELHFIVGKATATTNVPVPVFYEYHTKIGMTKSYNNPSD